MERETENLGLNMVSPEKLNFWIPQETWEVEESPVRGIKDLSSGDDSASSAIGTWESSCPFCVCLQEENWLDLKIKGFFPAFSLMVLCIRGVSKRERN